MIAYRDFVPEMTDRGGVLRAAEYQTFDEAVTAAGAWIQQESIDVLHIETVVLPNIWSIFEEGSIDPALRTSGETWDLWHQFVRVWYRPPASAGGAS